MHQKGLLLHFLALASLAVLAPASTSAASGTFCLEMRHGARGPPTILASDDLGELVVVVREGELGGPVAAVFLRLEGPEERTGVTGAEGTFRFERLPAGTYTVRAEHLAYGTVEVEVEVAGDDHTTYTEIHLHREPIALDPLVVEVERARPTWGLLEKVYERVEWQQRLGLGRFITREDIENRIAMRISDLLRGRYAGVRVGPGGTISMTRSRGFSGCGGAVIYIDGIKVGARSPDAFVSVMQVELIEIYRGLSQVPAEFADFDARCGVVAVWTRRGF